MSQVLPVVLLLHESCGERAQRLAGLSHVWVVDSQPNCDVARAYWDAQRNKMNGEVQGTLTTFKARGITPEEQLAAVIETIEVHHNEASSSDSYRTLIVEGARLTGAVRQQLQELGFTQFNKLFFGFWAAK